MPGATVTFRYNPVLGTATADGTGAASLVIGDTLAPGVYTIEASSPDGRRAITTLTVVDVAPVPAPSPTDQLPSTGSDPMARLWTSLAAVLLGAALVAASRRRVRHTKG